jgi:hypothetical protein
MSIPDERCVAEAYSRGSPPLRALDGVEEALSDLREPLLHLAATGRGGVAA